MKDLTKAQEHVKTKKGFLYHHVFNSKDEANGWKNFVSSKSSNLKAPPPGNQKVKKVIVAEDIPHLTQMAATSPAARNQGGSTRSKRSPRINRGGGVSSSPSSKSEPSSSGETNNTLSSTDSSIGSTTGPRWQRGNIRAADAGTGKPQYAAGTEPDILAKATPGSIGSKALYIPVNAAKEVAMIQTSMI
jgi:hypothetical protein